MIFFGLWSDISCWGLFITVSYEKYHVWLLLVLLKPTCHSCILIMILQVHCGALFNFFILFLIHMVLSLRRAQFERYFLLHMSLLSPRNHHTFFIYFYVFLFHIWKLWWIQYFWCWISLALLRIPTFKTIDSAYSAFVILIFNYMMLWRCLIIHCSSSSTEYDIMLRSSWRFIVLNVADISMLVMKNLTSSMYISQLCTHTRTDILLFSQMLWLISKQMSTSFLIPFSTMRKWTLGMVFSNVIGHKFKTGLSALLGFCRAIISPLLMLISCVWRRCCLRHLW